MKKINLNNMGELIQSDYINDLIVYDHEELITLTTLE